jgi:tetratricopeptide (TPR) repeat protein
LPAPLAAEPRAADGGVAELREPSRRAAARYQEGVRAYEAGRYKDAIDCFREADSLAPSPALSFNAALAHDKLLDTAGALAHYREYLRRDPAAQRAQGVRQRIRELETELARRGVQQITVQSQPAGATVVIDDKPLGVTPWTGVLEPGSHGLQLRFPGYADFAQRVELTLEQALTVDFSLTPAAESARSPAPSPAPPRAEPEQRPLSWRSPWPWLAWGGSAASFLTAGGFELARRSAEDRAKSQTTQIGYDDAYNDAEGHRNNARIFAGVGAGLAVTGVVLLLVLRNQPSERRSAAVSCSDDGCFGRWRTEF